MAFAILAGVLTLSAEQQLEDGLELKTKWNGKPLITGEFVTFPDNQYLARKVQKLDKRTAPNGSSIFNRWTDDAAFPCRREAAQKSDGTLEIGFQGNIPSYADGADEAVYGFTVDLAALEGMKYRVVYGRTARPQEKSGVISNSMPDGNLIGGGGVRVLALTGNDGREIVFDFNPEGVTSYSDYGPNLIQGVWNVAKEGNTLRCFFGIRRKFFGGVINSRVVIFEGGFDDWVKRHAFRSYTYFDQLPTARLYAFGAGKIGKGYTTGSQKFDPAAGFGWRSEPLPEVRSMAPSGALYQAVAGNGNAVFGVESLRNGLYLATLRFTAFDQPTGAATITVNGKKVCDLAPMRPGHVSTVTVPFHVENGRADFGLSGNWQLSTLALQLLLTDEEDFKFRRGFWLAEDLFEPSTLFRSQDFSAEPEYRVAVETVPLVPHRTPVPKDFTLNLKREILLPENNDALDWRYAATIGSLGPSNFGHFGEFDTPEKLERRLDELEKSGIKAILLNGFLSRHTFPEHRARVDAAIRSITAAAHKRGMKVIDHQDFSLFWNHGSGLRTLTPLTGSLLRAVDTGVPTRGICLNDPVYRQKFFQELTDEVRESGIDGLMIDEVSFFDPKFCGCAACRAGFTAATGLTLPMDETDPELFNRKSTLWKAWQAYRMKCVGDWFVELRRTLLPVKKDFTLMVYTTHYGWYSTYATLTQGASLTETGRGCDFQGTEIMSRNVIVSRRPVMAFRKMKSAINFEYGKPIFGLVYPQDNYDIAYFGWALNNMNNQVTWFIAPVPRASGGDFLQFPENNDKKHTRTGSNLGILYSMRSKDYAVNFTYNSEPLGISELLSDLNIPNDFLLEESLRPEKLAAFDTLLVLNASNLTDNAIQAIRNFAEQGGTVYLSGHAAAYNELGDPRRKWPFADLFGGSIRLPVKTVPVSALQYKDLTASGKMLAVAWQPGKELRANVLMTGTSGKRTVPHLLSAPCGKGRIIYSAIQLGALLLENEQTIHLKYAWNPDPAQLALARSILRDLFGGNAVLRPVDMPEACSAPSGSRRKTANPVP